MNTKFEKVMVIGSGQLAYKCALLVQAQVSTVDSFILPKQSTSISVRVNV